MFVFYGVCASAHLVSGLCTALGELLAPQVVLRTHLLTTLERSSLRAEHTQKALQSHNYEWETQNVL